MARRPYFTTYLNKIAAASCRSLNTNRGNSYTVTEDLFVLL